MATGQIAAEYDFIVIGGGTSGLVVATRLAEDPNVQVLVLEAGQDNRKDPRVSTPALWTTLVGSELDWKFKSTPQEGLKGRVINLPQGRTLGGSSSINSEAFIAPSQAAFDAWEKAGNPGWNWSTMAPYYQKFHTLNLPDNELSDHLSLDWAENGGRGVSGPLQISFTASAQDPFAKPWIETFRNLNLPLTADPALGKGTGGYSAPGTVDPATKTRSSSASAFYTPAEKKPNLHVVTGAQVQKILFEQAGLNLTTTGVSFRILQYSSENVAKAKKEVILAAGTFQSPKLLELSGIGSAELLRKHGIPVLVHNPHVGEHLRDHLLTGICFEVKDGLATADGLLRQEPDAMQTAMQLYAEHKTGPLAAAGWSSHAFVPVLDIPSESDRQMELQKIFEQYPPEAGDEFQFNFVRSALEDREVASSAFLSFSAQCNLHADFFTKDLQPGNFVTIGTYQVHPVSSGSVHISSPDPVATPIIDPRYLSHPLDVEIMAWCLQFIEKIAETEPVRSLLKPGGKRNHPTAYVKDLKAARDYARTTASTGYHPVSTCVMLPREKGGVVNERLIVYGTTNLRVVDASVMVVIPRGNTQSSVYAIAERAADIIKEDNHLRI